MRLNLQVFSLATALVMVALVGCSNNYGKPDRAPSQLAFGVDMAKRGLWSEALFRFQQAEQLDPGNANIFNNMAVATEAVGDFDRARELYDRALRLAPGNPEIKRNYARFVEFYNNYNANRAKREDDDEPSDEGEPMADESATGDGAVLR